MLRSFVRIQNFCWVGDTFQPSPQDLGGAVSPAWRGQFAFVSAAPDGRVTLVRDRLGINKLFFTVHESGQLMAANYLIDLVRAGVPAEAIYAVPAGHAVEVDPRGRGLSSICHTAIGPDQESTDAEMEEIARDLRAKLEAWFARLAERFGRRKICVCLSGGFDSSLIAALARAYFQDVTAYTFGLVTPRAPRSEDVTYAERMARALRLPFRFVRASPEDVYRVVDDALSYGQDWRDFNVHCAIVNELLARAIRDDAATPPLDARPLVLTGDMANEFLADYTPVLYRGQEYYRLPRLDPGDLRLALLRGLDAGDREVGVYHHHGLDVIQPYGFVLEPYLRVPASFLSEPRAKQRLGRLIAGDLLPQFVFDRAKVRAQIGTSTGSPGILAMLIDSGRDSTWLRQAFCRLLAVKDQSFLDRFIRAGRYRTFNRLSFGRTWVHGYLAA